MNNKYLNRPSVYMTSEVLQYYKDHVPSPYSENLTKDFKDTLNLDQVKQDFVDGVLSEEDMFSLFDTYSNPEELNDYMDELTGPFWDPDYRLPDDHDEFFDSFTSYLDRFED
jgi:hypothetical protein